jgi:molecular chaperone GrpE
MVDPRGRNSKGASASEATKDQQVASAADASSEEESPVIGHPEERGKPEEATVSASADSASPAEAPDEEDEDHESKVASDLEELTAQAQKAQEYLELAQRTKADFENYRKRAARDAAAAQERGVLKLARELLPAIDNLDRALEAAQAGEVGQGGDGADGGAGNDGAQALVSGIKLVHSDLIAALTRAGIERFSPDGEPFDPQRHEAVAQQPVEGAEQGTVVEVYQRGYLLGDAVIRPARVVVAG